MPLPPGAESVELQPDGNLRVRTTDDPIRWLHQLPAERVVTVEIGATRVEDVYRVLDEHLHPHRTPEAAS